MKVKNLSLIPYYPAKQPPPAPGEVEDGERRGCTLGPLDVVAPEAYMEANGQPGLRPWRPHVRPDCWLCDGTGWDLDGEEPCEECYSGPRKEDGSGHSVD